MNIAKPQSKRLKRSLPDEQLVEIALERFDPLGKGLPAKKISDIAKKHQRDPAVIQRAIASAFAKRLVAVERVKYPAPARRHGLEEQLLHKFPQLHTAIVIETINSGQKRSDQEQALFEDKVHDELGKAFAHFVSTSGLIRDRDRIGIGSGRGVFSFLKWLSYNEKLRAADVTVISLTGDVYARSHSWWKKNVTSIGLPGLNCQLDADDHLNLLGLSFDQPLNMLKMSNSIAWEKDELRKMIKQTVLDEEQWQKKVPDLGIIGVGVLSSGHRLFEEADGPVDRQEERLKPIIADLMELVDLKKAIETPGVPYVPVGDIGNRLFYVRPPEGIIISKGEEARINSLIDSINEKLLTATKEQLREIRTLILIAGTKKKAFAIRQLLEEGEYNIRRMCVDQEAASLILGLEEPS